MSDKLIFPTFEMMTIQDEAETVKQGRPCFKDVEHVRIRFAGDPRRVLVAPAKQQVRRDPETNQWLTYAQMYPDQYAKFLAGLDQTTSGTPISELPFLTEAKRQELRALSIHNAEALAALDGGPLARLGMGGRELKNKAQAYLDAAAGTADVIKLASENDAMRSQLEALQQQMAVLLADRGSAPKASGEVAEGSPPEASPFWDWSDEDIVIWITESGGERPHPNCAHRTLVKKADDLNAELAKKAA